jgi:hypothetical protein
MAPIIVIPESGAVCAICKLEGTCVGRILFISTSDGDARFGTVNGGVGSAYNKDVPGGFAAHGPLVHVLVLAESNVEFGDMSRQAWFKIVELSLALGVNAVSQHDSRGAASRARTRGSASTGCTSSGSPAATGITRTSRQSECEP